MQFITTFLGRFHPLIVHLPIGILFVAFVFECLAFGERYRVLRKAVQPSLLLGALAATAAAVTGFFLRQEGGYDTLIADRHQNFGILTAVLALVVYVLRPKVKYWVDTPQRRHRVKLALSVPLIVCLTITGHWGGSLTHGEDYLFAAVTLAGRGAEDPAEVIRQIANVEQAVLYHDIVRPIFEARCYDCHSASKQKGELRLDGEEFIARGGESGAVIRSGPADSSSLYKRLVLPSEHDDHMPPNEKPQLSSSEIALIQHWIEGGARFDQRVSEFQTQDKIASIVRALQQPPQESWIPDDEVSAADNAIIEKLKRMGVTPMPLAEGSNYLMVTLAGKRSLADDQINGLQEIREQLLWLNLSYSGVSDQQLEGVGRLGNLRVLYLNNTGVTDAGVSKLSALTNLQWLSIAGAKVSDESVETLSTLKGLKTLYLFDTDITDSGIGELIGKNDKLKIDTGNYRLEKLPTDTIVYKRVTK